MKVLHILSVTVRPYSVIRYIKENFNQDEHIFLMMMEQSYVVKNYPDMLAYPDVNYALPVGKKKKIRKKIQRFVLYKNMLEEADVIFWHTHKMLKGRILLPLACKKKYLDKSIWIEYDREIYYPTKHNVENIENYTLRSNGAKLLNFENNCRYIGLSCGAGREKAEKIFKNKSRIVDLPRPLLSYHTLQIEKKCFEYRKNKNPVIWIGYNGCDFNQHEILINAVAEKVTYGDPVIMVPLNFAMPTEYGNSVSQSYVWKVKKLCSDLNIKCVVLRRRSVPTVSYYRTLSAANVAVFTGEYPDFADKLYEMLWMGKKVFIESDSCMYRFLTENGIKIFPFEMFETDTNEKEHKELLEINQKAITALEKKGREQWVNFFNKLREEIAR